MIAQILDFSVHRRWLVLLATLVISSGGFWSLSRLPIDAVPDVTNVQVQINAVAPALTPIEIEKQVTCTRRPTSKSRQGPSRSGPSSPRRPAAGHFWRRRGGRPPGNVRSRCRCGRNPLRLSDAAPVTCPRSVSLARRMAKIVPHWERMVGSISDGRWLTIITPTPYLRPSFAMRRTALDAVPTCSLPR